MKELYKIKVLCKKWYNRYFTDKQKFKNACLKYEGKKFYKPSLLIIKNGVAVKETLIYNNFFK